MTPATPRDPRIDPRKGDLLRNGRRMRLVREVKRNWMEVGEFRGEALPECAVVPTFPWVRQWRKWAANAEVIHVAE